MQGEISLGLFVSSSRISEAEGRLVGVGLQQLRSNWPLEEVVLLPGENWVNFQFQSDKLSVFIETLLKGDRLINWIYIGLKKNISTYSWDLIPTGWASV